jgi:hypothetical protein
MRHRQRPRRRRHQRNLLSRPRRHGPGAVDRAVQQRRSAGGRFRLEAGSGAALHLPEGYRDRARRIPHHRAQPGPDAADLPRPLDRPIQAPAEARQRDD